jgi:hypothetical protein
VLALESEPSIRVSDGIEFDNAVAKWLALVGSGTGHLSPNPSLITRPWGQAVTADFGCKFVGGNLEFLTLSCGKFISVPPTTSSLLSPPSTVMLPPRPKEPADDTSSLDYSLIFLAKRERML